MEPWCFSLTSDVSVCCIFHPSFLPGRSSGVAFLIPWISSIVLVIRLVCCSSVPKTCLTLCDPLDCNMPGSSVLHYLLEFAPIHAIELMMPSNHLILYCLLHLPSVFSSIRAFTNQSALCIRWPKYWDSALATILPVNIQGWFPLGLTGLISLLPKRGSRVFSSTTIRNH